MTHYLSRNYLFSVSLVPPHSQYIKDRTLSKQSSALAGISLYWEKLLEHFRVNGIELFLKTGNTNEKRQGRTVVPLVLQKKYSLVLTKSVFISAG